LFACRPEFTLRYAPELALLLDLPQRETSHEIKPYAEQAGSGLTSKSAKGRKRTLKIELPGDLWRGKTFSGIRLKVSIVSPGVMELCTRAWRPVASSDIQDRIDRSLILAPWKKNFRAHSFLTASGLMPAQTRTKGIILWTPFLFPEEHRAST